MFPRHSQTLFRSSTIFLHCCEIESESNLGTRLSCGVFCFPIECGAESSGAESSGAVWSLGTGQFGLMRRAVIVGGAFVAKWVVQFSLNGCWDMHKTAGLREVPFLIITSLWFQVPFVVFCSTVVRALSLLVHL